MKPSHRIAALLLTLGLIGAADDEGSGCIAPPDGQAPTHIDDPDYMLPPITDGWSAAAGVWANVVPGTSTWRARIHLGVAAVPPVAVAGIIAESSIDGATWNKHPARRFFSSTKDLSLTGELPDGVSAATLQFRLYYVNRTGFRGERLDQWDHDGDFDTPEIPLAVSVPVADATAPDAPTELAAEVQPGAVRLTWCPTPGDAFGYAVERSIDGAPFEALHPGLLGSRERIDFRDLAPVAGSENRYRVWAEDVSGQRSPVASDIVTVNLP